MWGGRVIAGVLSLIILVGSGWIWATYRNFTKNLTTLGVTVGGGSNGGGIDGTDQNILIVGNDDRDTATDAELKQLGTTRDGGSYNTDTMMVLHVPANGAKATMISFPRDSWVNIPGQGYNKLNAAYVLGMNAARGDKTAGAQLLINTIQSMTGLTIDHYVQVDLIGFYRISNAIGGVNVCLNAAMGPATKYGQVGNGYDSGFEGNTFVYSYSGINLHAGQNTIMGTQALAFVRQRHGLPDGDLDRIKRQQYFLSAVFRQMTSTGVLTSPSKITALLNAVSSSLQVDKSLNLLQLASQMRNLQAGNFQLATIPTLGFGNENLGGTQVSVVEVDTNGMKDFVDNLINNDAQTALNAAKAANPADVTLDLYNDTSKNGAQTIAAQALLAAGFHVNLPPATTDVLAKTTIRYPSGGESAAKALAQMIPGATLVRTSTVKTVTLLLGNDGLQVTGNVATPTPTPTSSGKSSSGKSTSATPTVSASTPTVSNGAATAADAGCIN